MKQAFLADSLFMGTGMLTRQALLTENKIVTGIADQEEIPPEYTVSLFPDCLIAPAFIDMQLYGGNGKLFSHSLDMESLEATHAYCVSGGCAHFMITMATSPIESILKGIDAAGAYLAAGKKGLLGLHLEGPWINPLKKGAHVEAFIHKPSLEEVSGLVEKGKGIIKMITLAPELCSDEIIRFLLDHGILISAGHSNARLEEAKHAFEMGIPTATHLFNAMSPLQGREPGLVGAIFDDPRAMSSIVCDGIHVDFASVRISKKIMRERLYFITDAVTNIEKGYYQHIFQGDRYTLANGTLSGSCMTMISTFRNAVQHAGISIEESLKMCSSYPARLLKDPSLGKITIGQPGNFNIIHKKNLELVYSMFD